MLPRPPTGELAEGAGLSGCGGLTEVLEVVSSRATIVGRREKKTSEGKFNVLSLQLEGDFFVGKNDALWSDRS